MFGWETLNNCQIRQCFPLSTFRAVWYYRCIRKLAMVYCTKLAQFLHEREMPLSPHIVAMGFALLLRGLKHRCFFDDNIFVASNTSLSH